MDRPFRHGRFSYSIRKEGIILLFSSLPFLYVFLLLAVGLTMIVPKRAKNYVLLGASLAFYFFGEPLYGVLIVLSSLVGYAFGLLLHARRGKKGAKLLLGISAACTLAPLLFFKYGNFVLENINAMGKTNIPLLSLALPLGISFYTFQILSYTVDVYRGDARVEKNPLHFMAYVTLFPQLIAGPIVRYRTVQDELTKRRQDLEGLSAGILRFSVGLGKKVLLADSLGELCKRLSETGERSVLSYWLVAIAFTLEIYYDFSGYSDMAIGLGRMLGFHFPENFDHPFLSKSVTEFWRRWHMTLGTWFRDYVYIPMGGNRCKKSRWLFNILTVWLLTGLWHGASWNFILWGLFFALFLLFEKCFFAKVLEKMPRILKSIYLLTVILFSFVIFNADSMGEVMGNLSGMFGGGRIPLTDGTSLYLLSGFALLLLICAIGATDFPLRLVRKIENSRHGNLIMTVLEPLFCLSVLIVTTGYLTDGSFSPFLYFRF